MLLWALRGTAGSLRSASPIGLLARDIVAEWAAASLGFPSWKFGRGSGLRHLKLMTRRGTERKWYSERLEGTGGFGSTAREEKPETD